LLLLGVAMGFNNSGRAENPALKGWELYSWTEAGEWRFALLLGTNRTKRCAEIKNPNAAKTIFELEAALARLARLPGEQVYWEPPDAANLADDCLRAYPPAEMVTGIKQRIHVLELIDLTCPHSPDCVAFGK
jgi:hypothetical protein